MIRNSNKFKIIFLNKIAHLSSSFLTLHRPKRKMRQTFYKKIKILLFFVLIV